MYRSVPYSARIIPLVIFLICFSLGSRERESVRQMRSAACVRAFVDAAVAIRFGITLWTAFAKYAVSLLFVHARI